jgi:hypothetical protein
MTAAAAPDALSLAFAALADATGTTSGTRKKPAGATAPT